MSKRIGSRGLRYGIPVAALLIIAFISMSAHSNFVLLRNMDMLFTVFRDAMQLTVDEPNPDRLVHAGIDAMLRQLDPYSEYYPKESEGSLQFLTTGGYAGIGAIIQQTKTHTQISMLYEGTPAQKAGLRVGDTIVAIDGESIKGLPVAAVSAKLKGNPGEKLTVTINRPYIADSMSFLVTRDNVNLPAVTYAKRFDNGIAYIDLTTFTAGCAGAIQENITKLQTDSGINGLILDLRGNGGGLIDEATKIVSLFIPPKMKVVQVRGRDSTQATTLYSEGNAPFANMPLAILVDRNSASSSEVVTGALQDLDRAIVLGEHTFGKGLVQTTRPLPYQGIIKLTTAKYYTPSGRCIQALDYRHRDPNGAVGKVPDSLIRSFSTANGRTVYDGGGIWPDIPIKSHRYSILISNLYRDGAFFAFANRFRSRHEAIAKPNLFEISNQDMEDFLEFMKNKGFQKQTPLQDLISQVRQYGEGEDQYEVLKPHLDSASKQLERSFDNYFIRYKKEIKELLEEEIVSRYYYQEGRMAKEIQRDSLVQKAIHILMNPTELQRILKEVSPPDSRDSIVEKKPLKPMHG